MIITTRRRGVALGVIALTSLLMNDCKQRTSDTSSASSTSGASKAAACGNADLANIKDWNQHVKACDAEIANYVSSSYNAEWYDWFQNRPLGLGGLPVVVLKTLIELYPNIWSKPPNPGAKSQPLAFLGLSHHPDEYDANGDLQAKPEKYALPYGFAYYQNFIPEVDAQGKSTNTIVKTDNVFFSCGGCHSGRVLVPDASGKNHMKIILGGPNTEVEAQEFAGALLATVKELVVDLSVDKDEIVLSQRKFSLVGLVEKIAINKFLDELNNQLNKNFGFKMPLTIDHLRMVDNILPTKIRNDLRLPDSNIGYVLIKLAQTLAASVVAPSQLEKYYGPGEANIARARQQIIEVLKNPAAIISAIIASGKKAQFMYEGIAGKTMFVDSPEGKAPYLFGPRPGQMDAFGVATALTAMHTKRPGNTFVKHIRSKNPANPLLGGKEDDAESAKTLFETRNSWLPTAPANSDIKSLFMAKDRYWANWDGNQSKNSRVLASGLSSVGDPSKVDTTVHEPMNAFIDELPAPAYPFPVDLAKAREGEAIFNGKGNCANCHKPQNQSIYNVGTDKNRANQITETSRLGAIALIRETCDVFQERVAAGIVTAQDPKWCERETDEQVFVSPATRPNPGYKADVLHGLWSQAPFLHNGSVPTLWHLLRPDQRPATFTRGNINYDQKNVGFVWDQAPTNYPANEIAHYGTFNTALRGNSNKGHTAGSNLTDDEARTLLEYLKTL